MRLIATDPLHLVGDGRYIKTPEISVDRALVEIDIEIFNDSDQPEQTVVATSIIDPNGQVIATSEDNASVRADADDVQSASYEDGFAIRIFTGEETGRRGFDR